MTVGRRLRRMLAALVLVPLLALTGLTACGDVAPGDANASGTTSGRPGGVRQGGGAPKPGRTADTIRTVPASSLPPEARRTLKLIDAGGPFPYRKDGSVFANREHRLPSEPNGYYREYTVPTPGAGDRGARRIIGGRSGERYYTQDHYRSFARVTGG
ncbi:guanine-specific ribonuclease N1 and T1 [Actinomadura logoneensis]|uniref:Guanine-specific ribonuclease N1 and T1 n=1 Tax=Actinomadura logoneensis TaxID=2293572 RepID=A0A372JRC3_9ACTN|nr:ribonuclease domain-containing protein [Actinomadura logoneensis]RFU42585.1 guanine-specific ribonuclease N1 and T1 [Actinomadura logoneensis]